VSYAPVALGFLPGGSESEGFCISADGGLVGGTATNSAGHNQAVYWDSGNVIQALPDNATGSFFSAVFAMSADGAAMTGRGGPPADGFASIWRDTGSGHVQAVLATLGSFTALPRGMSADSTRVVGGAAKAATGAQTTAPVTWDALSPSTPPVELPLFVVAYPSTQGAYCVNANGSIIFGSAAIDLSGNTFPVRWTATPGPGWIIEPLDVPALSTGGIATACTPDGVISVGFTLDSIGTQTACYWTGTTRTDMIGASASGVDLTGQIISGLSGDPVVWLAGVSSTLPLLPAAGSSFALAAGVSYAGLDIAGEGYDSLLRLNAIRWVFSGSPPPPFFTAAVLNMDNVVVTSLTTESPCTVAQYTTPPDVSPALGLRWSDTRGQTFGNAVAQQLSTDPLSQLQWNRTGYARDRVFELFWSAALKTALNGAFIEVEPWKS
jgi:uncharacterized membrane protein